MSQPIYTPTTCSNPAFELEWSYSAFWRGKPTDCTWLDRLKELNEPDQIRMLSRAAIVPDHIHLTLGCGLNESPEEVVLS